MEKTVDYVAAGGRIVPQLWHVGSVRNPAHSPNSHVPSVGPSGLRKPWQPAKATTSAPIAAEPMRAPNHHHAAKVTNTGARFDSRVLLVTVVNTMPQ